MWKQIQEGMLSSPSLEDNSEWVNRINFFTPHCYSRKIVRSE
jgi:hypothetical protein